MIAKLFEAALGITDPWGVASVEFDEKAKTLTVLIDFKPGTRFAVSGHEGLHPVHDTLTKTYRHLNSSSMSASCGCALRGSSCPTARCAWSSLISRVGSPGSRCSSRP